MFYFTCDRSLTIGNDARPTCSSFSLLSRSYKRPTNSCLLHALSPRPPRGPCSIERAQRGIFRRRLRPDSWLGSPGRQQSPMRCRCLFRRAAATPCPICLVFVANKRSLTLSCVFTAGTLIGPLFISRRHAKRGLSHRKCVCLPVCPSVRPSVTLVDCAHTVRPTITISSPYGSPMILVFWRQISSTHSNTAWPSNSRSNTMG